MNITFVMCVCWLKYAYALMFVDDGFKSFGCVDRSCVENMEFCHWVWCGHAITMWSPISHAAMGGNREPELHLFMLTKFSVKFSVQDSR